MLTTVPTVGSQMRAIHSFALTFMMLGATRPELSIDGGRCTNAGTTFLETLGDGFNDDGHDDSGHCISVKEG